MGRMNPPEDPLAMPGEKASLKRTEDVGVSCRRIELFEGRMQTNSALPQHPSIWYPAAEAPWKRGGDPRVPARSWLPAHPPGPHGGL